MTPARFNHMELTLPLGSLDDKGGVRQEIARFYGEVFGWETRDVYIVKQNALLLATDPEASQFILLTQTKAPMQSPGYDHLGLLYDTRAEVDEKLELCRKFGVSRSSYSFNCTRSSRSSNLRQSCSFSSTSARVS